MDITLPDEKATTGRPPFAPSKEHRLLVKLMVASNFTQDVMAEQMGIDRKTLRKYFRKELKTGKEYVLAKVAQSIYQKALGDHPQALTAAFFIMKTQGGWRETDRLELEHLNNQQEAPVLSISFANGGPGRGQGLLTDGVESDGTVEGIIEPETSGLVLPAGSERPS